MIYKLCFTVLTSSYLLMASAQKSEDQQKVRTTFNNYKSALRYANADIALALLNPTTLAYYQEMAELVKSADSLTLAQRPIQDKIVVLSARHRIPAEQAISMDGSQLFIYSIRYGMINKSSVENIEIDTVTVNGNQARASLTSDGQPVPLYYDFTREGEAWRIDLTSVFEISQNAIEEVIRQKQTEENQFILQIVVASSGQRVSRNLWQPLLN